MPVRNKTKILFAAATAGLISFSSVVPANANPVSVFFRIIFMPTPISTQQDKGPDYEKGEILSRTG